MSSGSLFSCLAHDFSVLVCSHSSYIATFSKREAVSALLNNTNNFNLKQVKELVKTKSKAKRESIEHLHSPDGQACSDV